MLSNWESDMHVMSRSNYLIVKNEVNKKVIGKRWRDMYSLHYDLNSNPIMHLCEFQTRQNKKKKGNIYSFSFKI